MSSHQLHHQQIPLGIRADRFRQLCRHRHVSGPPSHPIPHSELERERERGGRFDLRRLDMFDFHVSRIERAREKKTTNQTQRPAE